MSFDTIEEMPKKDKIAIEQAKELLKEHTLCEFCLGSLLATLSGDAPWELGRNMLELLSKEKGVVGENAIKGLSGECSVCKGLVPSVLPELINKALVSLSKLELDSFKSGTKLPADIVEREDELRARHGMWTAESLKVVINKYADEIIASKTGLDVKSDKPDVLVSFDFIRKEVEVIPASVYVFGRYRKLKRGLYQTRWVPEAEGTIESYIGDIMKAAFEAEDYKLHAAGREDFDVRMLGRGRPFVMELIKPRKRRVNLEELERKINSKLEGVVQVSDLKKASKKTVILIKESSSLMRKIYLAKVTVEGKISLESLKKLEKELSNRLIRQKTPTRVLHRRADLLREKMVYKVSTKPISESSFEMTIECDGGLYIKELIDGDGGRTKPSVSEILGEKAFCSELDVIDIIVPDELMREVEVHG
ncbi:MAG: tRNA pseudouridine(54/55) synthase Pus10 [Thermoproteota archaeon]|nr:MAG: tRNA pseudouridine(54/55) synthase Pus10 [Candidatus Korarchaeota archaeon]